MYIFGQSHIENVNRWQKMTDTIVFVGEPAVRLCKKVRSRWSGNWYKITSMKKRYLQQKSTNQSADSAPTLAAEAGNQQGH
jgi:hypothetical protein